MEIEQNMLNNKIKTVTAYYGEELIEWGKSISQQQQYQDEENEHEDNDHDNTGYQADAELFDSTSSSPVDTFG